MECVHEGDLPPLLPVPVTPLEIVKKTKSSSSKFALKKSSSSIGPGPGGAGAAASGTSIVAKS
jgi:hypothetical protein